jgi:hypothetical protein
MLVNVKSPAACSPALVMRDKVRTEEPGIEPDEANRQNDVEGFAVFDAIREPDQP